MSDTDKGQHILIIEDDAVTRVRIAAYFENEGFRVTACEDGTGIDAMLARDPFDVVLLDVNLPGTDGFRLAKELSEKTDVGIILVTARTDDMDRVVGLEIGADDYVTKPFVPRELLARVKNLLRRLGHDRQRRDRLRFRTFSGWTLDATSRCLTRAGCADITLTRGEFELLGAFLDHPGETLSRSWLMSKITHRVWEPSDRIVDVLVRRLRHKLERQPGEPTLIRTVHGEGYLLASDVD